MRSKHLSVRKCIDKKPDKIKGIVCICIILAVVCAGNMIQNYLISLKAAKIAKTSTTISNADISPYSHSISAEERLTKMMSLMQDNVNELGNIVRKGNRWILRFRWDRLIRLFRLF